jgi:NADPH2:quinone reductase
VRSSITIGEHRKNDMRAIRPEQPGGPELLNLRELATPAPGPGQVLVRVQAAGVNYIDVYHRTGLYPLPSPLPLGLEGAGVVEQVGPDVRDWRAGDQVAWSGVPGSYATHVLAPADKLLSVPEGVSMEHAAALPLQGMTVHYLTQTIFPLRHGHAALVHAAAGGVGLLLVQIAKRAGATVFGTVSCKAKAALALQAGADHVIDYLSSDFLAEVKRLTEGRGVDVVYDSVGKTTFEGSIDCLAPRGYLVLYGQASGAVPSFDPARLARGSLFITRPSLAAYTATRAELVARGKDVFDWVRSGVLRLRIGATFPLAEAAAAHRALEGRQTTGKVLLIP